MMPNYFAFFKLVFGAAVGASDMASDGYIQEHTRMRRP